MDVLKEMDEAANTFDDCRLVGHAAILRQSRYAVAELIAAAEYIVAAVNLPTVTDRLKSALTAVATTPPLSVGDREEGK